jgi:hypothetical protein
MADEADDKVLDQLESRLQLILGEFVGHCLREFGWQCKGGNLGGEDDGGGGKLKLILDKIFC